jgi:hypothetical protein
MIIRFMAQLPEAVVPGLVLGELVKPAPLILENVFQPLKLVQLVRNVIYLPVIVLDLLP